MSGDLDLFGHPTRREASKPGRPRHEPTSEYRRLVRLLQRRGLNHLQIAAEIGITAPTLRMYYFRELGSASKVWRRRETVDAQDDRGS